MKKLQEVIHKTYTRIVKNLTPIKYKSITLIILGIIDHLSNPIEHLHAGKLYSGTETLVEIILRTLFIFCGVFGLMGNGKTKLIRATVVGLPYIYLSIYYLIYFIENGVHILLIPMLLAGTIGFWSIFLGANYEQ